MAKWQTAPLANPGSASDRSRGKSPMATLTSGGAAPAGLVTPGNLDLNARKVFNGPSGDYRTENSMSIGTEQGETLIPTVVNGRQLTEQEAIDHYMQTGENLGMFRTPEDSDRYAQALHERQAVRYAPSAAAPKWQSAPLASAGAVPAALADASARSQFPNYKPRQYAEPNAELPVPRPGVSGPSTNIATTGLIENLGAGFDSGVNKVLGAPVDIPVWLGNSVINATNAGIEMTGAGRPIANIPNDLPGSSQGFERTQEQLGFTPPSAVVPADDGQKIGRAAAEATAIAAVPEVLAIKAGQVLMSAGPSVRAGVDAISNLFGQSRTGGQFARNMAVNAAAGGGAEAAMEAAPDGWEPAAGLAGGLTAATVAHGLTELPRAVQSAFHVLGDFLAPLSKAGQEKMAGTVLRNSASSPGAVIDAIDNAPAELVAGSKPTTFQQTGDMGLGGLERASATKNPAEFNQRRADQNTARLGALEEVQATGAPEQVVTAIRSHLDDIQKAADDVVSRATAAGETNMAALGAQAEAAGSNALSVARQSANALGTGVRPEVAGTRMRDALEISRAQAKTQERALWTAVDPDGTLTLGAQNTRDGALKTRTEMPASAKPMSGEEAAIFETAGAYADDVPFSELTALQSRLKTELRAERLANGESPAYRRLSILNASIQNDLEAAIVGRVRQEAQAVADGSMRVEDTLVHNVQKWVDDWQNQRTEAAVGLGNTGSSSTGARGGASGAVGLSGTTGKAGVGLNGAPGNSGLSGNAGGTAADADAIARLNAARAATKTRAETFDNKTLAPIRKRPGTTSPYDEPAASVPARIFMPGAKSPEAIQKFRAAVGDEQALSVLRDYAIDRFNKAARLEDGTVDPAKASAWLRQHSDAMGSFPELSDAIRTAARAADEARTVSALDADFLSGARKQTDQHVADTAKAEKAKVDAAQAGVVGRLLGLSDPQDVTRTIGSVFGRQDSVKQMHRIMDAIGDNPDAKEGVRKAIADFIIDRFVSNTESATSGLGTIKADQLQSFVAQHKRALEIAGFSSHEIQMMDDIAADLQRANRSVAAVKLPGGSNTAQDVLATNAADGKVSILTKIAAASMTGGGAVGWLAGGIPGVATTVAIGLLGALRQNGLNSIDDLVRDALLNPARARALMVKATPKAIAERALDVGQMYRRAALASTTASTPEPETAPKSRPAPVAGNALSSQGNALTAP